MPDSRSGCGAWGCGVGAWLICGLRAAESFSATSALRSQDSNGLNQRGPTGLVARGADRIVLDKQLPEGRRAGAVARATPERGRRSRIETRNLRRYLRNHLW